MTQKIHFCGMENNELQVFISIRSLKFLNQCFAMVAPVLSHLELCSLKDETFEKLMMIKSNHHSKSLHFYRSCNCNVIAIIGQ